MTDPIQKIVDKEKSRKSCGLSLSEIKIAKKRAKKQGKSIDSAMHEMRLEKNAPKVEELFTDFQNNLAALGFRIAATLRNTPAGIFPKLDVLPVTEEQQKAILNDIAKKSINKKVNDKEGLAEKNQ